MDEIDKMVVKVFFVAFVVFAAVPSSVVGDAEVMSHVTAHFGKALEECRQEAGLSQDIMDEFHHFWREDFEVVHRELGCAIICMSNKFSLIQEDSRIHHQNMDEYINSFPNGKVLAEKMVKLIHGCEQKYDDIEDECSRVVKVSACFKEASIRDGIAPEMAMIESVLEKY